MRTQDASPSHDPMARLRRLLHATERRIAETAGIPHDEIWSAIERPDAAATQPGAELRRPAGLTRDQEASWWDAHPEYWDRRTSPADELLHPERTPSVRRTRPVNLRLPVDLIDALKREAELRDLPYQALIRVWLREQLDRHAAPPRPSKP